MTRLRQARGWICYRIVMLWPQRWPDNRLCDWLLAEAGWYAFGGASW